MDAIECGIVKLPRVPVADNIPGGDVPVFRNLWEHIRTEMPKKGRGKSGALDPQKLPQLLQTALDALYGHYAKTLDRVASRLAPPLIPSSSSSATTRPRRSSSTTTSRRPRPARTMTRHEVTPIPGRLALFRNQDEYGNPLSTPRTLLIDSEQLESGEALEKTFRELNADAIERFRRDIVQRTGDQRAGEKFSDQNLLREVMNTVGKSGQLGESIRCVVSVSMLTEGWDANTVTHILGVRAFGTQLLCEQVVGRGLRRQSYDLNDEGLFNVEYADILGIPFDFTAKPVVAPPVKPRQTVRVHAVRPDRDALEIVFPRVEGYRIELPEERLSAAKFDHRIQCSSLRSSSIGPTETRNQGIVGAPVDLNLVATSRTRCGGPTILYRLTHHTLDQFRDGGGDQSAPVWSAQAHRPPVAGRRLSDLQGRHLPLLRKLALSARPSRNKACDRIMTRDQRPSSKGQKPITALLDPHNPIGVDPAHQLHHVKADRYGRPILAAARSTGQSAHCSDWEAEFCRVVERHPRAR